MQLRKSLASTISESGYYRATTPQFLNLLIKAFGEKEEDLLEGHHRSHADPDKTPLVNQLLLRQLASSSVSSFFQPTKPRISVSPADPIFLKKDMDKQNVFCAIGYTVEYGCTRSKVKKDFSFYVLNNSEEDFIVVRTRDDVHQINNFCHFCMEHKSHVLQKIGFSERKVFTCADLGVSIVRDPTQAMSPNRQS